MQVDLDMGHSSNSGPSGGTSPRLKNESHKSGGTDGSGNSLENTSKSKDSGTKKIGRIKRFMSMVGLRKGAKDKSSVASN
jgi:hypothetical protein